MMMGRVDDYGRPLILVRVHHPSSGHFLDVEAWVDTGFTGGFIVTTAQAATLNLPLKPSVPTNVAGGLRILSPYGGVRGGMVRRQAPRDSPGG
jgi:predicted aspartyl protease